MEDGRAVGKIPGMAKSNWHIWELNFYDIVEVIWV